MSDRLDLEEFITAAKASSLILNHFLLDLVDKARQKDRTVTIVIDADVLAMLAQARDGAEAAIEALTQAYYAPENANA